MAKFARLDAWGRAQIVTLAGQGVKPKQIRRSVRKKDGRRPTVRAVQATIAKAARDPQWRGENAPGGPGRKQIIPESVQRDLTRLVFKERGSVTVTVKYCQQRLRALRQFNRWCVARALHRAGYQWLRRRQKHWVPEAARTARSSYARWIQRQSARDLQKYAYVDGTTYYLARGPAEAEQKAHARLGRFVWRGSSVAEGLFHDNVGPSLYAAKQGAPVKVWGLLANGHVSIHVLPEKSGSSGTSHMNGPVYRAMMDRKASEWLRASWNGRAPEVVHLVQDHERCLWQPASMECLARNGFKVVTRFPKSSPDLNAIEGVWKMLREYLAAHAPDGVEARADFLRRLHGAVRHLNASHHDELLHLCQNQQERAADVLTLSGARTKW